jgi:hypothetical protein
MLASGTVRTLQHNIGNEPNPCNTDLSTTLEHNPAHHCLGKTFHAHKQPKGAHILYALHTGRCQPARPHSASCMALA